MNLNLLKVKLALTIMGLPFVSSGQITLDHTYQNSHPYSNATHHNHSVSLVDVGHGVYKYVFLERGVGFKVYNTNHVLEDTVTFTNPNGHNGLEFAYLSSSMFDCDSSNLEFMLLGITDYSPVGPIIAEIRVMRTDGTTVFQRDSAYNSPHRWTLGFYGRMIANTPNGTKMMLQTVSGHTEVYSLCDSLPLGYESRDNSGKEELILKSYPNPSTSFTNVEYKLPEGVHIAELVFYDQNGKEVRSYMVDSNFDHIRVSTNDLPSGTYIYVLRTSSGYMSTKKHVVIP